MCLGGVYNQLQSVDQRILSYPMDLVLASSIVSALYYICIAVKLGVRRLLEAYQLLEYQTDLRRCRFDTLGKQTSAPLAGGPTPYTGGSRPHGV